LFSLSLYRIAPLLKRLEVEKVTQSTCWTPFTTSITSTTSTTMTTNINSSSAKTKCN
jgi:hypothetical protein